MLLINPTKPTLITTLYKIFSSGYVFVHVYVQTSFLELAEGYSTIYIITLTMFIQTAVTPRMIYYMDVTMEDRMLVFLLVP